MRLAGWGGGRGGKEEEGAQSLHTVQPEKKDLVAPLGSLLAERHRCKDTTVHCKDTIVHCKDRIIHCKDRTVHCKDRTVHCKDTTVQSSGGV